MSHSPPAVLIGVYFNCPEVGIGQLMIHYLAFLKEMACCDQEIVITEGVNAQWPANVNEFVLSLLIQVLKTVKSENPQV